MTERLSIEEVLQNQGLYVGVVSGDSMQPMLRNREDTVVVRAKDRRLRVGEVALFHADEHYALHRVIAVCEDGYLMRGDNRFTDEWIEESETLGILTEFYKDEQRIVCTDKHYLRYVNRRLRFFPIRRFMFKVKKKVSGLFHKK